MCQLFHNTWRIVTVPQEFKDAVLFISPSRRIKKTKVMPRIISVLHVQYVYGRLECFYSIGLLMLLSQNSLWL